MKQYTKEEIEQMANDLADKIFADLDEQCTCKNCGAMNCTIGATHCKDCNSQL